MKQLDHTFKSYSWMIIAGCIVGLITRLTDFFPYDDIWGFSSIATLFGFWIITATLIVYFSSSNINAFINTFLYLFFMSLVFYISQPILGRYFPTFENQFKTDLFLLYTIGSCFAGICGFVLYFWNKKNILSNILYALPVGVLTAELIAMCINFIKTSTWLFQLLMDLVGAIVLGLMFYKKVVSKGIYVISVIVVALVGYFFYYGLFL